MALATKCPHCGTVFKVAADQLKLRGGIVRCGKCSEVFDGNAWLVDPDAAAHRPVPAPESGAPAEPPAEPESEEVPVYTLDFDTTFDPLGIIPQPVPADGEAAAEPSEPEATPQLDIDFDLDLARPSASAEAASETVPAEPSPDFPAGAEAEAEAEPGTVPSGLSPDFEAEIAPYPAPTEPAPAFEADAAALPEEHSPADAGDEEFPEPHLAESASSGPIPGTSAAGEETHASELVPGLLATESVHAEEPVHAPAAIEEPPEVTEEGEEPGFVTRVRKKEKATRVTRILMAIGSVLLLAGLLAQGIVTFASVLAARYPEAKPALTEACKLLRCQVALPAQIDTLSVETGELQTIASNTFLFATVLRNDSTLVQAWPHIELALTDTADKTLVRRVIAPAEYLPPRTDVRKGFAAKTEQPVKVYFQLTGVTASGYHIAIFHP